MDHKKSVPLIIAFGHSSRVGKDTAATVVHDYFTSKGKIVHRLSFAAPLKEWSVQIFGTPDRVTVENNPELRKAEYIPGKNLVQLWVELGTKLREIDDAVFLKALERQIGFCVSDSVILITDLRFPNEAEMLKKHGAKLIKILRPGYGAISDSDRALDGWNGWDAVWEQEDINILKERALALAMVRGKL